MPETPEAKPAPLAPASVTQRAAAWLLDAWLLALPVWWLVRAWCPVSGAPWRDALDTLSAMAEVPLRGMLEGATLLDVALRLLDTPMLAQTAAALQLALLQVFAPFVATFVLLAFVWHVGFERSHWRGSPGKRLLGLKVVDGAGAAPTLMRSIRRFAAGGASWLTLNVGHAMAALQPRRLALHDRLSATRVVTEQRALPAWARAWLLLQLALLLAAHAWLLMQLNAAVQAALEAVLSPL